MGRRNLEAEVENSRASAEIHLDKMNRDWNKMTFAQMEFHKMLVDANLRYAEFVQAEIDREPETLVGSMELDPPQYEVEK